MTEDNTCENCKYFTPDEFSPPFGNCSRYPPTPTVSNGDLRPRVEQSMWCGEFDRKED